MRTQSKSKMGNHQKKIKDLEKFREQQELLKKETEEILDKTDLSDQMKENYLNSLSYKQKDMRIKGNNPGSSYYGSDEHGSKYKRQQKELYQFEKEYFVANPEVQEEL